jgi:hypothetical protein
MLLVAHLMQPYLPGLLIMIIDFLDAVVPVFAKLPLGLLVPHFGKEAPSDFPFNPYYRDAIIASLSMVCRGEFNFVVASFGLSAGLLNADMYSAIVLAVLISSVFGPLLLSRAIRHYNVLTKEYLRSPHLVNRVNPSGVDGYRPFFIAIQIRTPASWGLHERFQQSLEELGLLILDHRTWHTNEMEAVTMSEIFVQDTIKHVKVKNCFNEEQLAKGQMQPTEATTLVFGDGSIPVATSGTQPSDTSDHTPISSSTPVQTIDLNTIPDLAIEAAAADSMDSDEETLRVVAGDGTSFRIGICSKKSIGIRLEQVRLELVACLGDINPESFAIKTTQWEPFLVDGPADEKGHVRQRTYTFQEDFPVHEVVLPTAAGEKDCDESLGDLSILDALPSSTKPLSRNPSSVAKAEDEKGEKQHVRFDQQYHDDGSPRTSRLPARPQAIGQQVPRSVSHGTNHSSSSQPPRHQRYRSHGSFSGHIDADLWDTDEVAHICVGPGRCQFQPAVAGRTVADKHFLALALAGGYESDDEEEDDRPQSQNDIEAHSPHHRRRRSRNFSEDRRQEEETAAIQHFLHGYIRR